MTSQTYTSNYSNNGTYLSPNFQYYGFQKVKAGKGYKDGKPYGVESGECQNEDCEGTIITLKINSSSKGMETSTEKVCNCCGRVYGLGFHILTEKVEQSHIHEWHTHKDWKRSMQTTQCKPQMENEGTALSTELYQHLTGHRPGFDTEINLSSTSFKSIDAKNRNNYQKQLTKKLKLNYKNSVIWDTNTTTPHEEWIKKQYANQISCCESQLQVYKGRLDEVKEFVEKYGVTYYTSKGKATSENVIMCYGLILMGKTMTFQAKGTLLSKMFRTNPILKTLYPIVNEKSGL
jgi:hypothetical protein